MINYIHFWKKMKSSVNISLDLGKTFPLNKPYLNELINSKMQLIKRN